jgi:hypothetical protein
MPNHSGLPDDHSDLAPTGRYTGPDIEKERPGTDEGVVQRYPRAEDDPKGDHPVGRMVQLSHDADRARYRLRRWREGQADSERYTELGRHHEDDLAQALEQLPDKPRFVVFENTDTGEVYLDRENNMGSNWTGDGRFDQVTLFEDETDAADYANERQDALS